MNWFFEGPWPILVTGVIVEAILIVALLRTGRGTLVWAIAAVGLLTAGLLLLERVIVTDNERIRATLDGVAAAAVANDLDGVLAYIGPDAQSVRSLATDSLRRYKIREAKIGNDLTIRIANQGGAPAALATFTGLFRVESPHETFGHDRIPGRFQVGLVKQGDRWLIVDVQRGNLHKP